MTEDFRYSVDGNVLPKELSSIGVRGQVVVEPYSGF